MADAQDLILEFPKSKCIPKANQAQKHKVKGDVVSKILCLGYYSTGKKEMLFTMH